MLFGSLAAYALVRISYRVTIGGVLAFIAIIAGIVIASWRYGLPWPVGLAVGIALFLLFLKAINPRLKTAVGNNDILFVFSPADVVSVDQIVAAAPLAFMRHDVDVTRRDVKNRGPDGAIRVWHELRPACRDRGRDHGPRRLLHLLMRNHLDRLELLLDPVEDRAVVLAQHARTGGADPVLAEVDVRQAQEGERVRQPGGVAEAARAGVEALILAMTPLARPTRALLKASRRKRIADGSGTKVQQVNQLVKQFDQMRKMMRGIQQGKMPDLGAMMRK